MMALTQHRTIPGVHNIFVQAVVVAALITALTFWAAYTFGWVTGVPNWLEIVASAMNYAATFLAIKQRRFYYLIGIGASAIYAYVYGTTGLIASAALSAYLTISLIYGYVRWGKDNTSRPVHHLQLKWLPAYLLATGIFFAGAYWTVIALGGNFAPFDAGILVLTVLAQFLLDNKVLETWFVWTGVNVLGATVYFSAGLPFAAIQQVLFGLANFWGWLSWRTTMKENTL
ncbi:nicotinamide riboside transporter PnuC [Lysinibacter cavernae]|uniref:nicotinamide riboside transporter PnuC n=1 Tax=Lysinibacter cavernae TaxID=1640652 RepID=UPI003606CE56